MEVSKKSLTFLTAKNLLILTFSIKVIASASGEKLNDIEIMRQTLPVYALIVESSLMNEDFEKISKCRSELDIFRRAVDNKTLWAIRSKFLFLFFINYI